MTGIHESMNVQLLFSDASEQRREELRHAFGSTPGLSILSISPDELTCLPDLDALFLPIIAAERWGSRPLLYQSQILQTHRQQGMPPFIVTGIALNPDDLRINDLPAQLSLVLTAVLDVVQAYNEEHNDPIRTIGIWTHNLSINRMDPAVAGQIIRSTYERKFPR